MVQKKHSMVYLRHHPRFVVTPIVMPCGYFTFSDATCHALSVDAVILLPSAEGQAKAIFLGTKNKGNDGIFPRDGVLPSRNPRRLPLQECFPDQLEIFAVLIDQLLDRLIDPQHIVTADFEARRDTV